MATSLYGSAGRGGGTGLRGRGSYGVTAYRESFGEYLSDHGEWRNPDTGNYGRIVPVTTYRQNGRYCREFTQEIFIGGQKQTGYGRACRQPDGSWEIVG